MKEFKTVRTALIDADIIAYQAAAWAHSNQGDMHDAVERAEATLEDWVTRSCCSNFWLCWSCRREDNFRKDFYPLYKSHRTGDVPAMLVNVKAALKAGRRSVKIPRLEADDVMGILATNGKIENTVIVTIDKDLRGIPGWHFNPDKEDFPVQVSKRQADMTFYTQWLTGDSTDGFGGIKGIGPAKAFKILSHRPGEDNVGLVMAAYDVAGMTMNECLAQARCARILRDSDFDVETREAIPWTPDNIEYLSLIWEVEPDGQ